MCFYRSLLFIGVGVIKGRDLGRNKSAVCLCELSLARERKKTIESSASSGPLSPCQTVSIGARRRAAGVHGRLRCAHEFYFCRLLECFVTFSTSSLRDLPLETTSHFTFIALGRKAAVFLKGADTRHVLDSMTLPSCSCISSLCLTELLFISHASVHVLVDLLAFIPSPWLLIVTAILCNICCDHTWKTAACSTITKSWIILHRL